MDKDGAVTAVDGRLFHTGMHRPQKRVLVGINKSGKRLNAMGHCLFQFREHDVVVQFYPCFNFFLYFSGMVMYDNELRRKENKI